MTDAGRVEYHEAGHVVVVAACGGTVRSVTVEQGQALAGCVRYRRAEAPPGASDGLDVTQPFVLWPNGARRWVEAEVLVALAGEVAEELFEPRPPPGRVSEPVAAVAAELVEKLPPLPEAERENLRAVMDSPGPSDAEYVAQMVRLGHGNDAAALAVSHWWLAYMRYEARALLELHWRRVRRLADVLAQVGSLSGEAVAAVLRER
jgi:hypothetical protein